MISKAEKRHALYRFYDARENLLYVGISNDPWRRWREHVHYASWYPQARHQAVTWYDTEAQARAAETRAIRSERPQFNIAGALRPPEKHPLLGFDVVMNVCVYWLYACMMFSIGIIIAAVIASPHSSAPAWIHVLWWVATVADLTLPLPMTCAALVMCAPWIYRFSCWLNLNFGDSGSSYAVFALGRSRDRIRPLLEDVRREARVQPIDGRRRA